MKFIILLLAVIAMPLAMSCAAPNANDAGARLSTDLEDSPRSDFLLNVSSLVAVGEIESSPKQVYKETEHEHLWYYYYPFKVLEVLNGKAPSETTMEIAVVWSGEKGDPAFLRAGDKVILFLEKPNATRPGWLALNRQDAVEQATPQRVAWWKRLIAAGPVRSFSGFSNAQILSTLDLRIAMLTNAIAPVSKRLTNGQTDVLELPIRIENHSTKTITASISHEWFGGIWPLTNLGAAVKKMDEPTERWRANAVYVSGELGIETEPTIWELGAKPRVCLAHELAWHWFVTRIAVD